MEQDNFAPKIKWYEKNNKIISPCAVSVCRNVGKSPGNPAHDGI
jgi:hypothetical protein